MSEPGINSSTVSDSLRMDAPAERQAFLNGDELPTAGHVKSLLLPIGTQGVLWNHYFNK